MKVRIVEENGKWYYETTCGRSVGRIPMKSKERAQQMLNLHNKYYRKYVLFNDNGVITRVRVTNLGLLYKDGEDNPPTPVLFIRYKNATWRVFESLCELDKNQDKE